MCAHQITVDYVNQPLQSNSTEKDHRLRYEQNQYADEQGCLNHQWLSLQEKINSKVSLKGPAYKPSYITHCWSLEEMFVICWQRVRCSDSGGWTGVEEQSRVGCPTAADQQLDRGSKPLDGLGSDTQQPDGATEEHQRLPGLCSNICVNSQRVCHHFNISDLMFQPWWAIFTSSNLQRNTQRYTSTQGK